MKALVGAFNQEKALVGAFSVIVQPVVEPMEHYTALIWNVHFASRIVCRDPCSVDIYYLKQRKYKYVLQINTATDITLIL